MKSVLSVLIRIYQYAISPWLGSRCRFFPSCSDYRFEAVDHWGPYKGLYLGARRLCRCHPWHVGGYDPVPTRLNHDDQ